MDGLFVVKYVALHLFLPLGCLLSNNHEPQILLDYVLILSRLPQLLDSIDNGDDRPMFSGATAQQEVDDLVRRVPNVIENLPGVFDRSWSTDRRHIAARGEMIRSLVAVTERVSPTVLVRVAF